MTLTTSISYKLIGPSNFLKMIMTFKDTPSIFNRITVKERHSGVSEIISVEIHHSPVIESSIVRSTQEGTLLTSFLISQFNSTYRSASLC